MVVMMTLTSAISVPWQIKTAFKYFFLYYAENEDNLMKKYIQYIKKVIIYKFKRFSLIKFEEKIVQFENTKYKSGRVEIYNEKQFGNTFNCYHSFSSTSLLTN